MIMNIDDIKTQATELATKLQKENDIRLQRTAALDLICAAYGYKNHHLLACTALTRPDKPNLALIERITQRIASRIARYDDNRLKIVVNATLAITYPVETATVTIAYEGLSHWAYKGSEIEIPVGQLSDPSVFLSSPAGKDFIAALASDTCYWRYYRHGNDSGPSNKCANKLATEILKAIEEDEFPEDVVEEYYDYGQEVGDYYHEELRPKVDAFVENLDEQTGEVGHDLSEETLREWRDEIEEYLTEALAEKDDSSIRDMLFDTDTAEVVFIFKNPGNAIDDDLITSNKPWSETCELALNGPLQHALASLGYTLGEFRRAFKNKHKPWDDIGRIKRRRTPVVTLDQLEEMIDNASSQYFLFVWYGIVPLKNLLDLSKGTKLELEGGVIGTYNPFSGTFHDSAKIERLVVEPSEGELRGCYPYYTPDDICGLVRGYYAASIKVAEPEPAPATEN